MSLTGVLRRAALGAHRPDKVFRQRGFEPRAWPRFAPVAEGLALGYNVALHDDDPSAIVVQMQGIDRAYTGFAYEGVGMGLQARDLLAPRGRRLAAFVDGPGSRHIYPVLVGAGLALARLRRNPTPHLDRFDPVVGWAVLDGYGFHAGFFERRHYVFGNAQPTHLAAPYRSLFDQGLGRAIWFASGGVVESAAATVASLSANRHGDLWNGVGMACAYGGGADRAAIEQLRSAAAGFEDRLAWGAATAAWTRWLAGNPASHTDLACEVFVGFPSVYAASVLEQGRGLDAVTFAAVPIRAWREHFMRAVPVA